MEMGEEGPPCGLLFDESETWDDAETIIRDREPGSEPPATLAPGQPRLLPLGFGLVLGLLLSSLAFAALERPVIGLRVPERAEVASTLGAADGRPRADFEITPFAVASRQTQRSHGARRRTGTPVEGASTASRVSKPSEANPFALLESKVRTCAAGQSGTARLQMTVQPSGLISHAIVYGRFEGAEGSCMAKAVRGVYLPTTTGHARVVHRSFSW